LLEFLEEYATLAWYLLADADLVEVALLRALADVQKRALPNDITASYAELQKAIIRKAIELLGEIRQQEKKAQWPLVGREIPDLARLTFILRLIIRRHEKEVADYLRITSAHVKKLVLDAFTAIVAADATVTS
jgi:hypothetical protein